METKMEKAKNLIAKFITSYPKVDQETGEVREVFVFTVKGSKEDLEGYAKDQGTNYKVDQETGEPLFFTVYPIMGYDAKEGVPLRRAMKTGKWGLDNGKQRRAEALANAVGAGKEFHQKLADRLTGMLFGDTQSAPQVTVREEDLKDL